jgi:hypothetical protein
MASRKIPRWGCGESCLLQTTLAVLGPFTTRDNSGRVVIDGQARSNGFLTDGILTTNTYQRNPAGIAPHLSPDSVQEFQVVAGNYAPEFGGPWVES